LTIRIGVIGAGALGFHHVRLLRQQAGTTLVGFHESNSERASHVAKELGVRAFAELPALLDQIDAAVIVVPTKAHFDVASSAIERGVHVLIEKPISATLAQADALVTLARDRKVLIQVGHVERFNRAVRAAMPYLDAPKFVESERLAPFNPRGTDVAVVLDLMIHDIDLVHALVRDRVADVRAVGVGVLTDVDMTNAWLAFEGGAVANIKASRVSRDKLRKLRVFQRNGYFSLDLGEGTGEFYRMRGDVDVAELAKSSQSIEKFVERIKLKAPEGEPLRLEHESFVAAITGAAPVVVTGEDGRDALDVALRIVDELKRSSPLTKNPHATPRQPAGRA
jgi:predicted dehydrogenase